MAVRVSRVRGLEILDSRGNPTIRTEISLSNGITASASVPSGASTGSYEAHELRDGCERYRGKGVLKAIGNINTVINDALVSETNLTQRNVDMLLCSLDDTENKSRLGANAILSVSLAFARACAKNYNLPLYRYLGGIVANTMPVPMMNILNGGAHASNNVDIQEFMIMPIGTCCFAEGLRIGSEIYHMLGKILKGKGLSTGIGDEGGYAPNLNSDEQAIEVIIEAIEKAGYNTDDVKIALDSAASEWYNEGKYVLPKRNVEYTTEELISYWENLCEKYPIISIEDGLSEKDWQGFTQLTSRLGNKIQLVGDDLFVTNSKHLQRGIDQNAANAILIKYNQIGTLSETLDTIFLAKRYGFKTIISHRSGETEDTTIADLAVAVNAGQIKTGAPCRSDRTSKYNRLLKIESEIKCSKYGII